MKPFTLLLFFIISTNLYAQSTYQHWEWAKSFGGAGDDITSDIKVKNGFVYVTGTFTSPTINWENTTLMNNGNRDIFVAKLDTNGNTIWIKSFGGTADDTVRQLEINNDGVFVLLCESSSSNINFGSVQLNNPTNFYAKFDAVGNLLKAQVLPDSLTYDDIDIDNDGGVYAACDYNHHKFTFANTLVDTLQPSQPPVGAPVVYIGSQYYYTDPQNIVYYTSGSAILKYDSFGNQSWIKIFHGGFSNTALNIAFDHTNNTIVALFEAQSAIDFDGVYYYYHGSFYAPESLFLAGLSQDSTVTYSNNNLGAISTINGLEIDNNGLGFVCLSTHAYGYIGNPTRIISLRNGQIQKSISDYYYGPNDYNILPYAFGTLKVGENGHTILNNDNFNNNIFILDSTLRQSDSIIVPDGGKLLLHTRGMAGKALYFGDKFSGDSLVLKIDSVSFFTLHNQGSNDIFIGKFHSNGFLPLSLKAFKDTIKFCYEMDTIELDSSAVIKDYGSGNLKYKWAPSSNFANPDILNTRVIMTADTLISTLTVTDATDDTITKTIVFYNGIRSDIHLKLSDSAVCSNSFIDMSLAGSLFGALYVQDQCTPYYKYSFDSLNQISHVYSGNCLGFNSFKLLSESPKYCFDTTPVKLQINPTYNIYDAISLCAGSNYTFPNDTTITNITQNYRRVRYLRTTKGCDSTTVTDLIVITTPQTRTENISICAGSNYTFPDSTMQNNIQINTSHESILKAAGGCDSMYITTFISVSPLYRDTSHINVCAGSTFTFPDSTIANNIQANTTHTSHFYTNNGCDSSIITNLVVTPPISATENNSVCPGSDYAFPDNTRIDNIQNDITHISHLTSATRCDSLIITNLHVIIIDTTVAKNNATLNANLENATYHWFDCTSNTLLPSETGQSFTATLVGNYAVQLQKNGCVDTSSCYAITYDDLLNHGKTEVSIYPIPTANILNIKFISEVQTTLNMNVYNDLGKAVISDKFNLVPGVNEITLNVSSLQRGVYALLLFNNYKQEKIVRKIIVD